MKNKVFNEDKQKLTNQIIIYILKEIDNYILYFKYFLYYNR